MKERPISFMDAMVLATLEDRKTQTRRVMKVQPPSSDHVFATIASTTGSNKMIGKHHWTKLDDPLPAFPDELFSCPYGKPGDRLWVRESWRTLKVYDHLKPSEIPPATRVQYRADKKVRIGSMYVLYDPGAAKDLGKWRSLRFMMRWMSRIDLEVTEVRVPRVQDIDDEAALAEGIVALTKDSRVMKYAVLDLGDHSSVPWQDMPREAKSAFMHLWDSINGKKPGRSWDENPMVWAVSFKGVRDDL